MPLQWAVLIVWLLWLLVYWRGGLTVLQDLRAAQTGSDRICIGGLAVLSLLITLSAAWVTSQMRASEPGWLIAIGGLLVAIGAA